jgi:hypothetical protein
VSRNPPRACPVCKLDRVGEERRLGSATFTCEGCGTFILTGTAEALLVTRVENPRNVAKLRHWIRRRQSETQPPSINSENLDNEVLNAPLPTPPVQQDLILGYFARSADGEAGRWVEVSTDRLISEIGALGEAGIVAALDGAKEANLLEWGHRPSGKPGVRARLKIDGWRAVEAAAAQRAEPASLPAVASSIRIFVSHTSADEALVRALVDLLKAALGIPADQIRCTSLDGHRLPGGADIDATIRAEVAAADVMLAIVTPQSLDSIYVIFEMGARWASERIFIPLLTPGVTVVPRPLDRYNGLLLGTRGGVLQLITELSRHLGLQPAPPEAWDHLVAKVVAGSSAARAPAAENATDAEEPEPELSDEALKLLLVIMKRGPIKVSDLGPRAVSRRQRTLFVLDGLRAAKLVSSAWAGSAVELTPTGRRFLDARGLL